MVKRVPRGLAILGVAAALAPRLTGQRASMSESPAHRLDGLWSYHVIAPKARPAMNVDGLFVFLDGRFVQQSLNAGEPFDRQIAQGHAGTYKQNGAQVDQVAEVGLIIDPTATDPVRLTRNGEHHITVARDRGDLTLTFSSGTVQTFSQVGPGKGRIYGLERGAIALVDGRFLLVAETGSRFVEGSGTFERAGTALTLHAVRWVSNKTGAIAYSRDISIRATFDEHQLSIPDEPVLNVTP
jgi:hypothetical protein